MIGLQKVAKQTFPGRALALRTVCLTMLVDDLLQTHSRRAPQLVLFMGACGNWGIAAASRYLGSGLACDLSFAASTVWATPGVGPSWQWWSLYLEAEDGAEPFCKVFV